MDVANQYVEDEDVRFIQCGQSAHRGIFSSPTVWDLTYSLFMRTFNRQSGSLMDLNFAISVVVSQVTSALNVGHNTSKAYKKLILIEGC